VRILGSAGGSITPAQITNPRTLCRHDNAERLDYIFASRDLALEDCSVVFDGNNGLDFVSDHFGVFCRLAFHRSA